MCTPHEPTNRLTVGWLILVGDNLRISSPSAPAVKWSTLKRRVANHTRRQMQEMQQYVIGMAFPTFKENRLVRLRATW